ncbi:MAG: FtsX-like permease family protein [Ignavibacteria bacterium]|nr:FtsX-like permease family protein [Ignavibacteria bacterium]
MFDIIGNINSVILVIAYLVIFTAAVSILVSIYNSMNERMREIAIMRSLGAGRFLIMKIIIFEGMFLSAAGALLGCIAGHAAVFSSRKNLRAIRD